MERKLATIQRILDIQPIEGADFIEKARVMGWDAVVKKGDYQVGDSCIFCEIDSIIPDGAEWGAFLGDHRRIRTKKLRGVLSQGLVLPVSILPEWIELEHVPEERRAYTTQIRVEDNKSKADYQEGDDVTALLDIQKYEPPQAGDNYGYHGSSGGMRFPSDIPKTDEIRIQSALGLLDELHGHPYVMTVKLDGRSMTAWYDDEGLHVASRNFERHEENAGAEWTFANQSNLAEKLKGQVGYVFQGELCGPGIQKNRLNLKELHWYIFNVYDRTEHRYLDFYTALEVMNDAGLEGVPVEEINLSFDYTLDKLLDKTRGQYTGTTNRREGIVVRPLAHMFSRGRELGGSRLSFKAINNDYLLKDEE